ncbi:uncharacterized protein AB675_9022 [Cyphellophora attinorum]|uniref:F-box domain-containing protein n=1 Tax=Cyphellophora attinorum TaxID=1664694 RepID=A0A0N1NZH9_9EURO|nr:uncharacterized protein AB675_9022 [Phialophora attinorum]KPI41612.1 hypothetical protein AB675_9022 [Phialophora attinorum]
MDAPRTFGDLDNDCIMVIIEHFRDDDHDSNFPWRETSALSSTKALSGVNRRYRQLILPILFRLGDLVIGGDGDITKQSSFYDALKNSSFAADCVRALSIDFHKYPCLRRGGNEPADNAFDFHSTLSAFLSSADSLRELRIASHLPKTLQGLELKHNVVFDSLRTLQVRNVPDAGALVKACPNLQVFCSTYPLAKPKTAFKAIAAHPNLEKVQLDKNGWTEKQLKELCGLVKGVSHLFLSHVWDRFLHKPNVTKAREVFPVLGILQGVEKLELDCRFLYEPETEVSTAARHLLMSHSSLSQITLHGFRYTSGWPSLQYCKVPTENDPYASEVIKIEGEDRDYVTNPFSTYFSPRSGSRLRAPRKVASLNLGLGEMDDD